MTAVILMHKRHLMCQILTQKRHLICQVYSGGRETSYGFLGFPAISNVSRYLSKFLELSRYLGKINGNCSLVLGDRYERIRCIDRLSGRLNVLPSGSKMKIPLLDKQEEMEWTFYWNWAFMRRDLGRKNPLTSAPAHIVATGSSCPGHLRPTTSMRFVFLLPYFPIFSDFRPH